MAMDHDVGLEALDDSPPPIEGGVIAGHAVDFEGLPLVGVRVEAAESGNEASLDGRCLRESNAGSARTAPGRNSDR